MSFFDRLLSLINMERFIVTLNGEEREGGYFFISSPELKGFSLLLEPGDYTDFKTFIDAVDEPLTAYMNTYQKARNAARHEQLRLRATTMSKDGSISAKMCFQ